MPKHSKTIEERLLRENPDLRAQGLRPQVTWIREAGARDMERAIERQIRLINESPDDVQDFLDRAAEDLFGR